MKKTRNQFFSEYGYNSVNTTPNMMIPNQGVAANSNFYAGPINGMNPNMYSDIDSRLSKLERQVNRLETRVSHLEGTNITEDNTYSNTMYMV